VKKNEVVALTCSRGKQAICPLHHTDSLLGEISIVIYILLWTGIHLQASGPRTQLLSADTSLQCWCSSVVCYNKPHPSFFHLSVSKAAVQPNPNSSTPRRQRLKSSRPQYVPPKHPQKPSKTKKMIAQPGFEPSSLRPFQPSVVTEEGILSSTSRECHPPHIVQSSRKRSGLPLHYSGLLLARAGQLEDMNLQVSMNSL